MQRDQMQRDHQITRMDLASDPTEADPTPGAKVVRLANRRRAPADAVDLSDRERPSDKAGLRVFRCTSRDTSRLSFVLRAWRLLQIGCDLDVHSDRSWAAPLCCVVLAEAVLAAAVVPAVVLSAAAGEGLRVAVAAAAGGAVLLAGTVVLLYLLRRRP